MITRKQNDTTHPISIRMVRSSDHVTGASGLLPQVQFTGGGGSGAVAHVVASNGTIESVVVDAGGSGYTSAPTASLVFTGSGVATISPCQLGTVTISGGAVTGVPVIFGGNGYGINMVLLKPDAAGASLVNGYAVAAYTCDGNMVEIGNGWYRYTPVLSRELDTLGDNILTADGGLSRANCDIFSEIITVTPFDLFGPAATNLQNFWTSGVIVGTVASVTNSGSFTLTSPQLSTNSGDYNNIWLCFTSGANAGVSRVIGSYSYSAPNKQVSFSGAGVRGAFPETVAVGDAFFMVAGSN